ncbi:cation diffusion facilitator family transporter [Pelagicoccus sp. SDUM812002]|uniref:cation diffusion facilitator family transporter n=1 Tax=Pelagicoccus sp. SDUM812002 TaxID=3041266 RepID=UPI00280E5811|nr:cation diffusion facilitator family transporter [Pelagicoccus sp. SDUM812002]MDQ8187103.1 cation diffusion facilitator family transporter [Pelagicoccus sp. SDUM812002]
MSEGVDPNRLSTLSLLANISLAGVKLLVGFFGNSFALIADGIESLADIVSSAIVWTGVRISDKSADHDHPYGHGKAEAIAALLASVGLLVSATFIGVNAVREILVPHHTPALFTVPVLVVIVLIKEWLHHVLLHSGRRMESGALKAEALHHRSDSLTSLGVLVGIGIAIFAGPGFEAADDIAALLVTVLIVYNAIRIARPALDELMDKRVEDFRIDAIDKLSRAITGIECLETIVVRRSGREFVAEIHMEVAPEMSIEKGHRLSHQLKDALLADPSLRLTHVVVHVEPFG